MPAIDWANCSSENSVASSPSSYNEPKSTISLVPVVPQSMFVGRVPSTSSSQQVWNEMKSNLSDHTPKEKENRKWLTRIQQDFRALEHAPEELRNDRQIVLTAVRQEGAALIYASPECQNDKEVVLVAVQQRGLALQFASTNLRSDKEVVLAAVNSNHNALRYAHGEALRRDRDCLVAAGMFDPDYDVSVQQTLSVTTKRIAMSTRFSLNPTSRSQATNFTFLLKKNRYIKQKDFRVYAPNAFNKNSCDPNWTDFKWPCRGTTETCKFDLSLKTGRPNDDSCWRYSFRCQLEEAKATGGFMLQLVEREDSLNRSSHQKLGNGQKIEEDMANRIGTKIFKVYRPLKQEPGDKSDGSEEPFNLGDIDKVVTEIKQWYGDGCTDSSISTIRLWHRVQKLQHTPNKVRTAESIPNSDALAQVYKLSVVGSEDETVHSENAIASIATIDRGSESDSAFDVEKANGGYAISRHDPIPTKPCDRPNDINQRNAESESTQPDADATDPKLLNHDDIKSRLEMIEVACRTLRTILDNMDPTKEDAFGEDKTQSDGRVETMEIALKGLYKISLHRPIAEVIINNQGVSVLLQVIRRNSSSTSVVKYGCKTLGLLIYHFPQDAAEASTILPVLNACLRDNPNDDTFQQWIEDVRRIVRS